VHDDLFWHLRTGEWIAAHHRVPLVDLFSYTRPGARWITHEWGFSLLSFLAWRAAGERGLVALTPLLVAAIFAAVAWRARELAAAAAGAMGEPGPPAAGPARCLLLAALTALGLWAASPELFLRAALVGELLLALALAGLARYRRTGRRRWLVAVAALFLPWANLHSGVVFGLFVLALHALEPLGSGALRTILEWRQRERGEPRAGAVGIDGQAAPSPAPGQLTGAGEPAGIGQSGAIGQATGLSGASRTGAAAPYLWTLAAAAALTLVNPNGLDAPLYPFILGRILFASGIPWELGHFSAGAPAGSAVNAPLWLLLVLLLWSLLPLRQQARRLSPAEAAATGSFALLSLVSHRFVFDLVVIGLPSLYKLLVLPAPRASGSAGSEDNERNEGNEHDEGKKGLEQREGDEGDERKEGDKGGRGAAGPVPWAGSLAGRPGLAAALAALFLLPVAPAAIAAAAASWARRPPAAGGLIAEPFPAAALRFAAAQGVAGPADRIFNHQNYGGFIGWRLGVPIFWDGRNDVFAELVREVATTQFGAVAARYRFDYLLIAEHDYPGIQPEIAAGRWGLVYWDDFCALYLRRGDRYAAPLGRYELRLFPPFGGRPGLAALAAAPRLAAAARAELAQVLAANPANQRALYFAGVISLYRGELNRAAAELRAAQAIRPAEQVDQTLALLTRLRRATIPK
jgi:hypothetical protein